MSGEQPGILGGVQRGGPPESISGTNFISLPACMERSIAP
jgi:hypothetical protein